MLVPSLPRYQLSLIEPRNLSLYTCFLSLPCVANRSRIELIEWYFRSQLNFATVSVINLSSASMTKLSAYMQ